MAELDAKLIAIDPRCVRVRGIEGKVAVKQRRAASIEHQTAEGPLMLSEARRARRASERLVRGLFDGSLDALVLTSGSAEIVDANLAAADLFGREQAALIGLRLDGLFADPAAAATVRLHFETQVPLTDEFPIERPDGARRIVRLRSRPQVVPGIDLIVLRDVTDQRSTERELRTSQERLSAIIRNAPIILFSIDRNGIYTQHEGRGLEAFEVRAGERVGRSIHEDIGGIEGAHQQLARALAGEVVFWEGDAAGRSFQTMLVPSQNEGGEICGVTGIAMDITEQRRASDDLRASEDRYRRIIETTSEGVLTFDGGGTITFHNTQLARMLGYGCDELLGHSILELVEPEDQERTKERIRRRREGVGETYEMRLVRKDRRELWVSITSHPMMDRSGSFEGVLAQLTDITEQRHARETRSLLAAIVDSSLDPIIGLNLLGEITTWNPSAERLYGYSAREIIGKSGEVICPLNRRDCLREMLAAIVRGETISQSEVHGRHKDGSVLDVSMVVSPIRDASGAIVGVSIIARDLSERRLAEAQLRSTEEQLRQAMKMEAIGRLAGGVAHDFNNLLSVILSYSGFALGDLREEDPIRADIEEVENAAKRASALTRQLLAFSRQQILQPQVIDLNAVVQGLEKMLRRLLGESIELTIGTDPYAGQVFADPGQIEQVLMNLVVNARDAMPDGGEVSIEVSNVSFTEPGKAPDPEMTPGAYVALSLSDDGCGMEPSVLARIFEPFFTTKEDGKGTGLGLSTVFGIVKQSSGHITVDSEPGAGTTFRVYLPRTDRVSARPSLAAPNPDGARGQETVLLVEDEDIVRKASRAILKRLGYNVLEAQNGGEALLICEQYPKKIDLLLTDVVMPRMTGVALADRLLTLRPDMKVLYVSGYTDITKIRLGGAGYLQKPITPQNLSRKVRQVLDESTPLWTADL